MSNDSNKRRCSACQRVFASRTGCDMHIRDKHQGAAERIAAGRPKDHEPSMAEQFIEAEMNRFWISDSQTIIQRNGLAFIWPESEAA